MAIITISRQVAAWGDEIAAVVAKKLNYTFIDRKTIERKLTDLGFPAEKLKKYDECKPGFFASLAKERDEYLDFLQTAMYEAAFPGNCILIGRGSSAIFADVPGCFSVRLVASHSVRISRLMKEFSWTEKQAQQRIQESDENRLGFHRSFFNLTNEDPARYHMVLNTGLFSIDDAAGVIAEYTRKLVSPAQEAEGLSKVGDLLAAQRLVNRLIFEHKLSINFLQASIRGDTLVLQGVADSAALCEQAVMLAAKIMPDKKIESCITVVQDFKSFP